MSALKKQAINNTIDILTAQASLPLEFEGAKLYGEPVEDNTKLCPDCKVYKLSNETGTGKITTYQVFSGIELYYNKNNQLSNNLIKINSRNFPVSCNFKFNF